MNKALLYKTNQYAILNNILTNKPMATIINNPGTNSESSGAGAVIGAVVVIVIVFLFFMYGLPAIRHRSGGTTNINVNAPGVPGQAGVPGNSGQ